MIMQQEDGWPLGLQPLSLRVGLVRNHGSVSFNTLLTGSPSSSTDSSSDLDTQVSVSYCFNARIGFCLWAFLCESSFHVWSFLEQALICT